MFMLFMVFRFSSQREEALAARKKFVSSEGDTITLLNIYKSYRAVKGDKVRTPPTSCLSRTVS